MSSKPRTHAQLLGLAQSILDAARVPAGTVVRVEVVDLATGCTAAHRVKRRLEDDDATDDGEG